MIWSPNCSGTLKEPPFVVVHYTASNNFAETRDFLYRKSSKRAYHYLIGRKGEVAQLVPLNKCAWHAGESKWRGYRHLSRYSFGIGLVSWGPLVERKGKFYPALDEGPAVPTGEVHDGRPPEGGYRYWQKFSPAQLRELKRLIQYLRATYPSVVEVVGHRDVAPGRKMDPWPLDLSCYNQ